MSTFKIIYFLCVCFLWNFLSFTGFWFVSLQIFRYSYAEEYSFILKHVTVLCNIIHYSFLGNKTLSYGVYPRYRGSENVIKLCVLRRGKRNQVHNNLSTKIVDALKNNLLCSAWQINNVKYNDTLYWQYIFYIYFIIYSTLMSRSLGICFSIISRI